MLKEISCPLFKEKTIFFKKGLNVVLGSDDAKNSIGKSTALMVIDFVMGGSTFLKDEAGVIKAVGHHYYNFSFEFSEELFFFCRPTDVENLVFICDKDYAKIGEISTEDYLKRLKQLYGLSSLESSFRSIVSPFSRIWRKGGLEPDQPFSNVVKESESKAISRLIDLFEHSMKVSAEKRTIDEQKALKQQIDGLMNKNIIPNINGKKYSENVKLIFENDSKIESLKRGFGGAMSVYEEIFNDDLQEIKQRKDELVTLKNSNQFKIKRLLREISGITPRLTANIALVVEYFPNVDVEKLEQVEIFHKKIGNIVKRELQKELELSQLEEKSYVESILLLEEEIQIALKSKGVPDDLFNRLFELKEKNDKMNEQNRFFDKKTQLISSIKVSTQRLGTVYESILKEIEVIVNLRLMSFNKVVYGPQRNSSALTMKSASSFKFSSPDDSGTGKSYAGLIGFDLALLYVTKLPFFIHDSVIYKNIEVPAVQKIIRIFGALNSKQFFLSFDEAKKFGCEAERTINSSVILRLGSDSLLYTKDWRDKK